MKTAMDNSRAVVNYFDKTLTMGTIVHIGITPEVASVDLKMPALAEGAITNYELILAGARAIMVSGFVYELRALRAGEHGTISGYFDDAEKLVRAAVDLDGNGYPIYVTLNPCLSGLLKRAANCVRRNVPSGGTTSDSQILCRFRLLIDFDPERPSGVSSTDAEKALAFEAAKLMRAKLQTDVTEEPVMCDSGNGIHLLYPVAWPNSDEAKDLVERALQTIRAECPLPGVKVDIEVGNAARITRLYGTMNCKGENTPERPWRRSGLLQ